VTQNVHSEPVDIGGGSEICGRHCRAGSHCYCECAGFLKNRFKGKEYLRVFHQVTRAVSSSLQLDEVLNMIVRILPEVMGLKAATIRLLDASGTDLSLAAAHG